MISDLSGFLVSQLAEVEFLHGSKLDGQLNIFLADWLTHAQMENQKIQGTRCDGCVVTVFLAYFHMLRTRPAMSTRDGRRVP